MDGSVSAVSADIDKILYSISDEISRLTKKLGTDAKITAQDIDLFIESLERRDHALNDRLERASTQQVDYHIPDSLKSRLLREIFQLEHSNTRGKIEQVAARHAGIWGVLKKIEFTVNRTDRYKVTVGKTESRLYPDLIKKEGTMKVSSEAFLDQSPIPQKYTCDGEDVSPPLAFSDVPTGTKSFALIVEDPDAPNGTFDHWIVWNLGPTLRELVEGATVPFEGMNHFGETRYRGPCPPKGKVHRYFFKLYALSAMLDLPAGSKKEDLEEALKGLVLDLAEVMGTYQR